MQDAIQKKPIPWTPTTRSAPCMRCQFGIFDVPINGKLNCFEAGTSNIKLLTKEEVEDMTFCDKMVHWTKMEFNHKDAKEYSELKLAEKLLGNR